MTPFSRTMRSLQSNTRRPVLIVLILAIIIWIGWVAWFFLAQITLTEVSQKAYVDSQNIIVADFPLKRLKHIKRGQSAYLSLDQAGGFIDMIPITVMEINNKNGQVRLLAEVDLSSEEGLRGKVEIETERLSPATLLLRASGLLADS